MPRIPLLLHYCFGMAPDFGGKPWSLMHYVCVRSAIERLRPSETIIHLHHEPNGPWWELTKPLVTIAKVEAPQEIFGRKLQHPAHQADVVRLETLIERGGIYLDADVFVHRSFDDLLDCSAALGREGESGRLANAVILAEPGAPFLRRWYEEYRSFRGTRRSFWQEHSVELPWRLAQEHPDEITMLHHEAFYWPLWTPEHIKWIFASTKPAVGARTYATHLWETRAWSYLEALTPGAVRSSESNFHSWAEPYLHGLPDHYGAPTPLGKVALLGRRSYRTTRASAGWVRRGIESLMA